MGRPSCLHRAVSSACPFFLETSLLEDRLHIFLLLLQCNVALLWCESSRVNDQFRRATFEEEKGNMETEESDDYG